MKILVTGAAGYIGSVLTEELIRQEYQVIALDNLSQGHRAAVVSEATFVQADLGDSEALDEVFQLYHIDTVMHLAAESLVEESMTDPKRYFHNNVVGGLNLLDTMLKHHVSKLVFSSTAAVYGNPYSIPIKEGAPTPPVNVYGESKLMFEKILHWYGHAYGLKFISLRYFNAAGASERFGEDHHPETHLIPNVLKAALHQNSPVLIFGTDYPTKDGSGIRDYVHVIDIAKAHMLALDKLQDLTGRVHNLGNSRGYSVFEVINTAEKVTGTKIPLKVCPRRPGDPAILIASSQRATEELGWKPEYSELERIVDSAWKWLMKHPNGYND
jgi:UDP-glucose 4-epimerase